MSINLDRQTYIDVVDFLTPMLGFGARDLVITRAFTDTPLIHSIDTSGAANILAGRIVTRTQQFGTLASGKQCTYSTAGKRRRAGR